MLSDPDLWCRLQAVPIGRSEAALSFVDRLARDNGWSKGFACRVIEEYRRFVYLCCVAGQPVTPSDEVDQAWHLHLTYTRSYWDDLCGEVLGRPLHHGPTRGGPDERRKYDKQYRATLERYAREFGAAPPSDVWPDAETRFGRRYVRIDRDAVWTIDRRSVRRGLALVAGGVGLVLSLAACAQVVDDLQAMTAFEKVMVLVALGVFAVAMMRWLLMSPEERARRRNDGSGCGSGCGDCGCGGGCD